MREQKPLLDKLLLVSFQWLVCYLKLTTAGQTSATGSDGSEFEMIKEVLLDTNIYLLSTTIIVSIFHMLFEMLAFKSDISHFRNKKNNVGISVRTILSNVFMQGVIFLYLLDNNDNTSKSSAVVFMIALILL